jgi:hypothetical protein
LGHEVALASAYNLLHRHNWRKLVPDKCHSQSDPLAQEEWKKFPETFTEIRKNWGQDKTSLGRIWEVRQCWAPPSQYAHFVKQC